MEFKIGDKVRVIGREGWMTEPNDYIGQLCDVVGHGTASTRVMIRDCPFYFFSAESLERVVNLCPMEVDHEIQKR